MSFFSCSSLTKVSLVPVLVVPPAYQYKFVQEALVHVDFSRLPHISRLEIYNPASYFLKKTNLAILNIDPSDDRTSKVQTNSEKVNLKAYLESYHHEIFSSSYPAVIEGNLEFAFRRAVQLIIALTGRHGFFNKLTQQSISDGILRNTHVPVLILK